MKKSSVFIALAVFACLPNCSCDQETYSRQSRPVISVNPLELDFGNVPVGTQSTRALDILNAGQFCLRCFRH